MFFGVFKVDRVPGKIAGGVLHVVQNNVGDVAPILAVVMDVGSLPGDFRPEVQRPEDRVHDQFQVVTCGRVAMEGEAGGAAPLPPPAPYGGAAAGQGELL